MLGKLYVEKHFTPQAKARMEHAGREPARAPTRTASTGSSGWAPRPEKQAQEKLAALPSEDRLPDQVARLLEARDQEGRPGRQRRCAPWHSRTNTNCRQGRQADRSRGMGHDAADGQRLLQPRAQRDRLPRRHPAAAVLRHGRRRCRELRRHRRGDRPRDGPRLRRPGPPLRRQGRAARLVDGEGRRGVQEARQGTGRAVQRSSSRCPA